MTDALGQVTAIMFFASTTPTVGRDRRWLHPFAPPPGSPICSARTVRPDLDNSPEDRAPGASVRRAAAGVVSPDYADSDYADGNGSNSRGCDITQVGQTLFLHGEIDFGNRDLLARAGTNLTARCTAARDDEVAPGVAVGSVASVTTVVIDAAALTFIDAAGLGVLITLHRALAEVGMTLRTIHPSAQLRRVSAICQLNEILGMESAGPDEYGAGSRSSGCPGAEATR